MGVRCDCALSYPRSYRRPDRTRETFARRGALYDDDYVRIRHRGRDDTGRAVASPVSRLLPKEIEEWKGGSRFGAAPQGVSPFLIDIYVRHVSYRKL